MPQRINIRGDISSLLLNKYRYFNNKPTPKDWYTPKTGLHFWIHSLRTRAMAKGGLVFSGLGAGVLLAAGGLGLGIR